MGKIMKKSLIIIVFLGSFVYAQQTQEAQLQALDVQIKQEKKKLGNAILAVEGGSEFLHALKNIKLQFSILSGELGIAPLFNQLSSIIDQECTLMDSDPIIQQLGTRADEVNKQIADYQKTPEFQKIQQLQKTVSIIYETPVLTYEQGQQAESLEEQIKTLSATNLAPLQQELQKINAQIAQRLRNYTQQINALSIKIRSILQTHPKMVQLRNQIKAFKSNPAYQQLAQSLRSSLERSLAALGALYDQEDALEAPCVMASPGMLMPASNLFDLINQAAVELLIQDQ